MAILIELFGLPGSGKTFLEKEIVKQLAKKKINVLNRHDAVKLCLKRKNDGFFTAILKKIPYSLWGRIISRHYCLQEFLNFSSDHAGFVAHYHEIISNNCISSNNARIIIGAFASTCIERKLFELYCHDDEIVIIDEGFCHRIFTLYGNLLIDFCSVNVEKYVKEIPIADGAIFVATPASLCIERMRERKRFPIILSCFNNIEIMNALQNGFMLFENLAKEQQAIKNACFRYDGKSSCVPILDFCMSLIQKN